MMKNAVSTEQDNFIEDVLANLEPVKKGKILNKFVITRLSGQDYYVASNLTIKILEKTINQEHLKDHVFYVNYMKEIPELEPLTETVLSDLMFLATHQIGFLISGVYFSSDEALAHVLKEMMKSSFIKK